VYLLESPLVIKPLFSLLLLLLLLLQIATASQLEPPTRSLAAECLVTLCEARDKAPGMVRRLPNFVGSLFDALMHFLLDIEDEPDWHRVGVRGWGSRFESVGFGFLWLVFLPLLWPVALVQLLLGIEDKPYWHRVSSIGVVFGA
jgi:hypothetical protein